MKRALLLAVLWALLPGAGATADDGSGTLPISLPITVIIPPGSSLTYKSREGPVTLRGGQTATLDCVNDSLQLNGYPIRPDPSPSAKGLTLQGLMSVYESIPYIRAFVDSSSKHDPYDRWRGAQTSWYCRLHSIQARVRQRYDSLATLRSEEAAFAACLELVKAESLLVDSAEASGAFIRAMLKGYPAGYLFRVRPDPEARAPVPPDPFSCDDARSLAWEIRNSFVGDAAVDIDLVGRVCIRSAQPTRAAP